MIGPNNVVTTLAGCGAASYGCGYANGMGTYAEFNELAGASYDPAVNSNVYVADYFNFVIRQVSYSGIVTTFAGTPQISGTADGQGTYAQFTYPNSMNFNPVSGTFFVPDCYSNVIRQVTLSGLVTTFAGAISGGGLQNGVGTYTMFDFPSDVVASNANGNIYVVDLGNCAIRQITLGGVVTTFSGVTDVGMQMASGRQACYSIIRTVLLAIP